MIPKIIPNSLDKIGSKTPLKITSSNIGAKNVVVKNKVQMKHNYYYLKRSQVKDYSHFDYQLKDS